MTHPIDRARTPGEWKVDGYFVVSAQRKIGSAFGTMSGSAEEMMNRSTADAKLMASSHLLPLLIDLLDMIMDRSQAYAPTAKLRDEAEDVIASIKRIWDGPRDRLPHPTDFHEIKTALRDGSVVELRSGSEILRCFWDHDTWSGAPAGWEPDGWRRPLMPVFEKPAPTPAPAAPAEPSWRRRPSRG